MKTEDFNAWFEVQKVTNKNYSKEQFDSMRDILEECWNYSHDSLVENTDLTTEREQELLDKIDDLEDGLNRIYSICEEY